MARTLGSKAKTTAKTAKSRATTKSKATAKSAKATKTAKAKTPVKSAKTTAAKTKTAETAAKTAKTTATAEPTTTAMAKTPGKSAKTTAAKTKTAKTAAKTAKTTATAKPKTAAKSTKTKKTAKAKTPAKSAKTTAAVRPKTAAKPETRAKKAATDDFELVRSDDHFELVGPSGARVGLRLGTKSRAREPGCRDRVELEISCRAAGKRRWQRVAYLYGRDSYEDELRYVLEDSTLWEAPLTACVAALGTAAAPPRLFAALAERCEDADAEEVIGLLIARWDRVYRRA